MVPMNRLGNKFFSSVLAAAAALSLAACGGGGSHASPVAAVPATAPDYTGPLADATLKIRIPGPSTSAQRRSPRYISSATKSLKFVINSSTTVSGTAATGPLGAYNARPWHLFDTGTLPNATCPPSGSDFICTVVVKLPPGTDNVTFSAYDNTGGTGNLLSQQIQNLTVVAAIANSFNVTFDANLGVMTVNGSGSCQQGPVGAAFGSVGTTPVNFSVGYTDPATKTIVGPGLPKLQIQDNTATYQSASGTINGTGGTVGFTINQAAQTFVLTPSTSSVTNASVNVKSVPANTNGTSDGLAFAPVKTFAFSTGAAPPAHNFLAAVEQLTAASGQVDFFNVTLGGSGGPDTFAAFSPATLAVTVSTNQPGVNDVDNPQDLRWDNTGDLLIANGGSGGGNNGNMACVPVGAIATGANSSTTVTANVDAPFSMAYDSRDGSVALANNPTSAPVQLAEYLLTGNYTAAAAPRNLTVAGAGSYSVTEMPSLTAGTYAIALTSGVEADPAHGGPGLNKIAMLSPTGVETDIATSGTGTDCGRTVVQSCVIPAKYGIDVPYGLAWDAANSQLVISNNSVWHPYLSFYNTSGTQIFVKSTSHKNTQVAASPDGHVAVTWVTQLGNMQVQVYDNTAARNPVFGPIPYNGTTTSCGATYIYGNGTTIVNALRWLSNTKLLVAVQSNNSGSPTALNGFYIYDITASAVPAGFDDVTCAAFAAAPVQSGFVHVNNKPLSAAFKP
jgi:hypothetical protein